MENPRFTESQLGIIDAWAYVADFDPEVLDVLKNDPDSTYDSIIEDLEAAIADLIALKGFEKVVRSRSKEVQDILMPAAQEQDGSLAEHPTNGSTNEPSSANQLVAVGKLFPENQDNPDWHLSALCAQTDPEAFFPEKGGSTKDAKKTCMSCEVRQECLDYALEADERFGIWGGKSERERRKLKKQSA